MSANAGHGPAHALFIVIAGMMGTGILTTTGLMAQLLPGAPEVLAVWAAGALLALCGALCYSCAVRRCPVNGGEAAFISAFHSPALGRATAALSFIVGFAASNSASGMALSAYAEAATGMALGPWPGVAAILAMSALHSLARQGMRAQSALACAKFLILCALACAALIKLDFSAMPIGPWTGADSSSWSQCLALSVFAYSGWNAAIYCAAEFKDPCRHVPRAMLAGLAVVASLYFALNLAMLCLIPYQKLSGNPAAVAELVQTLFGRGAMQAFSAAVALGLLSSIGVNAYAGSRVLMASLGKNSAAGNETARLVWIQAAVSCALLLTGTFGEILNLMGVFLGIAPVAVVAGLYRKSAPGPRPGKAILWAVAPCFIAASLFIIGLAVRSSPKTAAFCAAIAALSWLIVWAEKKRSAL